MKIFTLKRHSSLPRKKIFKISTDIKNFNNIMPNYFKSIKIVKETEKEKFVIEEIKFLGITLKVKTKHIIIKPNIHEVYILSGPTKGTQFIETYVAVGDECDVVIEVKLVLNGWMKIFGFLEGYIAKKMSMVMDEFISLSEQSQALKFVY